jgi:hypothetical protein
MLRRLAVVVCVTVGLFSAAAPPVRAGPVFTLVAQSRTVSATAGAEGTPTVGDGDAAPDASPFDGTARAEFLDENYRILAVATTRSTLTDKVLSFTGDLSVESVDLDPDDDAEGPIDAAAEAEGSVTFRLGVPHRLHYVTNIHFPRDVSVPDEPASDFSLVREEGPGGPREVLLDAREGGASIQLLAPGTYTYSYFHDATSFPGGLGQDESNHFATELRLEAVPLPSAAWAGTGGAAMVVLAVRRRRAGR